MLRTILEKARLSGYAQLVWDKWRGLKEGDRETLRNAGGDGPAFLDDLMDPIIDFLGFFGMALAKLDDRNNWMKYRKAYRKFQALIDPLIMRYGNTSTWSLKVSEEIGDRMEEKVMDALSELAVILLDTLDNLDKWREKKLTKGIQRKKTRRSEAF